tara:strand:+ start:513 stop:1490 length:978 start_codon:yes stop_codon:yes gene_type:complete
MKLDYFLIVISLTLTACQPASTTETSPLVASNAVLPAYCIAGETQTITNQTPIKLLAEGFIFLEGPVWLESLNSFLFSEMDFNGPQENGPRSVIHRLTLPATIEVFIDDAGSNGLATDGKALIAATHDDQGLSRYELNTKTRSVLLDTFEGKQFNSPNDLAITSKGHIYFSDPDWQLGTRANETDMTGVYHLAANGTVTLVDGSLRKPNGVTLSADQQFLYVGDADGNIGRYAVEPDGSTGQREEFAQVANPDGMGMDCAGNLYVASHNAGQLHVISPQGKQLAMVDVGTQMTNVAFGGPEHKTILLTAGGKLFSIDSPIAGFPY